MSAVAAAAAAAAAAELRTESRYWCLLQVGGSVPAHGSLRGMLAQVGRAECDTVIEELCKMLAQGCRALHDIWIDEGQGRPSSSNCTMLLPSIQQ
eukprot:1160251-Pelagomonas_calceolata.AAC.5